MKSSVGPVFEEAFINTASMKDSFVESASNYYDPNISKGIRNSSLRSHAGKKESISKELSV